MRGTSSWKHARPSGPGTSLAKTPLREHRHRWSDSSGRAASMTLYSGYSTCAMPSSASACIPPRQCTSAHSCESDEAHNYALARRGAQGEEAQGYGAQGCMHKVSACAKAAINLHHGNASRHVTTARGRSIIRIRMLAGITPSEAQHNTPHHSTGVTQHSTAQQSIAQHRTTQHSTAQNNTEQHRTTQNNTA